MDNVKEIWITQNKDILKDFTSEKYRLLLTKRDDNHYTMYIHDAVTSLLVGIVGDNQKTPKILEAMKQHDPKRGLTDTLVINVLAAVLNEIPSQRAGYLGYAICKKATIHNVDGGIEIYIL